MPVYVAAAMGMDQNGFDVETVFTSNIFVCLKNQDVWRKTGFGAKKI